MNEVEFLTKALQITRSPVAIFGRDADEAQRFYHKLAMELHPDAGGTDEAFALLSIAWQNYDPTSIAHLRTDEIADSVQNDLEEIKTVRDEADSDLLQNEVYLLRTLCITWNYTQYRQLYPATSRSEALRTTLTYNPTGVRPDQLITLAELGSFYGDELDIRHLGWIWHRIVHALGFAHRNGFVHGAVTPDSILIGPYNHDVILTNWYFGSYAQEPLKAISSKWLGMYPVAMRDENSPIEVIRNCTLPGLDFYMAARTMVLAFPHMPNELNEYFQSLLQPLIHAVPTGTGILNENFDRIIYGVLHWRYEYATLPWFNWEEMRNA